MYTYISILLIKFGLIYSNILEAENNFEKPRLERNNIVNKGVWVRNKFRDNLFEKGNTGDFLFRANSLDVDNILQNNFDAFGANYMQDIPFVSTYVERAKRATNHRRKRRPRKSMKNCKNKIDCGVSIDDKIELVGSKLTTNLKPSSVYNDYPYEVAILLNNDKEPNVIDANETGSDTVKMDKNETSAKEIIKDLNYTGNKVGVKVNGVKTDYEFYNVILKKETKNHFANSTIYNTTVPKRNKKHDYYNDEIKNIEFVEDFNKTDGKYPVFKTDRGIFDQQKTWNMNSYSHDTNAYKIVPKMDTVAEKSKPVTERGLIKVISMLTKTFKKVMKHHNEIKEIHERLIGINDEFSKNIATVNEKLQSFDDKYSLIIKYDEKLKDFDKHLKLKEDYFMKKQQEISNSLLDFEDQQRKFLSQQKQFYMIQKLMLAQNEKINIKQNLIAKTQSEISHRQNNFARILKKAKQLYTETKNPVTKLNTNIAKPKHYDIQKPVTTTPMPVTESIKINLFSIPANANKLEIKDDLIIKEKDEQPIDDLVYKYYFNNTFIDNLIKSKILTSIIASPDQVFTRSKNKRNGQETTLLLPVNNSKETNRFKRSALNVDVRKATVSQIQTSIVNSNITASHLPLKSDQKLKSNTSQFPTRPKRWINHISKKNHKHHHEKSHYLKKNHMNHNINIVTAEQNLKANGTRKALESNASTNPFVNMAKRFCVEIGQNVSEQVLSWCVEKALRRLQIMDTKLYTIPPAVITETPMIPQQIYSTATDAVMKEPVEIANNVDTLKITDNEELESNLKQFDMTADTEGNFYYDGSLHASDVITGPDSGDNSDILTGFESNSHMEVDPYTLYLQAMRRASVIKINENILKSMKTH
ncbi:hypothetical protein K1T71_000970 [Dendrolimus kikuchii]|uniref:Uncharacterized protein n=1 Tax=Dendrolimus kikuchii TaxID=765133 RepID=A0ACC1DGV7_9NEOP|nr:hypothetical protein K1T71_000970 [Dendrolimus kikuchii]